MKDKTIKSILKRKFNSWLKSIEDEKVRKAVEVHSIITGGSIVSLMLNEKPKDYDVYFDNKETTLLVAHYYVDQFNKKQGPIKNKIGSYNKAFVLDGDRGLEEQLKEAGYPILGIYRYLDKHIGKPKRSWDSHMLTNLEPGRVKIIVRSDGVASENEGHLDQPFEDVYDTLDENDNLRPPEEIMEDADDIPADYAEAESKSEKDCKKYIPIFLTTNAITLSDKIQVIVLFHG